MHLVNKKKNILLSVLSLVMVMVTMLSAGSMTVFADSDPEPFYPKDGEHIYSVEPFDAEHSAGYFCMKHGEGHGLKYGVYEDDKKGWFIYNTEKDENIYIDHYDGACFNGEYFDIREYVWQTDTEWSIVRSDGANHVHGTANAQIHREVHFYRSGTLATDTPEEVTFKGVMCLTDMDINEGYSFHTGLKGVWLNDKTHITKRDDVTWKGTWENHNDGVHTERETMWVEIEGSPESPFTFTYWGNGGHGSGINYYGNTIQYKLVENNLNSLPEDAKPAVGVHCATYAEYSLMPAEEFLRYEFSGWFYDKELTQPVPETIMVSQDFTFYGTYIKVAGLIETEVENGSITPTDECVPYGTDKEIGYTANEGYLLESVTVDGEKVDISEYANGYTFYDVQDDHYIKAVYVEPSMAKDEYISRSEFIDLYKDGEEIGGMVLKEGDVVTYTISFENPTGAERTVVITDKVPVGMGVLKNSISDNGEITEDSIVWTLNAPEYTKGQVSFDAKVLDFAKGEIISNTAFVTFKALGSSESDVTKEDTVSSPILADPLKGVRNISGNDITNKIINSGAEITYEITFINPSYEEKVFTVTDEIPDDAIYIEGTASDGGIYSDGVITWQMTLTGNETKTVSFIAKVNKGTEGKTICNQAKVSVDNTSKDTITTDPADPDDPRTPVYVLEDPVKEILNTNGQIISIDGNGNSLQSVKASGDEIIYRISFKNPANDNRTFTVKDVLPAGVEFVTSSDDYTYDATNRTVYWTKDVEGGKSGSVTVTVKILKEAEDTIIQNDAVVSVDDASGTTNIVETPVIPTPVKDAFGELDGLSINTFPAQIGESFFYTVTFKNPADTVKTAVITDKLPEGVSFVSASDEGKYDDENHAVTWNIVTDAHAERTVSVKVKANRNAVNEELTNKAQVLMDEANVTTITHNGDGDDETTTNYVTGKIVINSLEHDIDKQIVSVGDVVTYKIPYQNRSENVRSIMITDILPQGVLYMSASEGGNVQSVVHGQTVIWVFDADPKTTGEVWVKVKVTDELAGLSFANSAMIEIKDMVTGQEKKTVTNQVINYVLDDVTKEVLTSNGKKNLENEKVKAGAELLYTITVSNPSVDTKTFVITDDIPEGAVFVKANNDGVYDKDSDSVKWEVELKGTEEITVSFVVKVDEKTSCTFIENVAKVEVDETSANSSEVKVYVKGNDKKTEETTKPSETEKPTEAKPAETTKPAETSKPSTTTPSNNTNTGKVDAPKTGDESNISLWIKVMIGVLALAGLTGGYLVIKAHKEEE